MIFLLTVVAKSPLSHLTVSNMIWDRVTLSWKAQESTFDSFLIEVRNTDHLQEKVVHSVSATAHSLVISNLKASSNYTAHLHGLIRGQHAQTLMVQATTGISPSGFFFLYCTSFEENSGKNFALPIFFNPLSSSRSDSNIQDSPKAEHLNLRKNSHPNEGTLLSKLLS